jgi:tetratricopeptide (TPR) repeat protein
MNSVLNLNNKGILCLKDHNISESLACFTKALLICKSLKDCSKSYSELDEKEENYANIIAAEDLEVDLVEQENFTYWKAMKIQQIVEGHPEEDERTFILYSFACVFNLALGHHLSGLITSSPFFLRKAIKLYEQAYGILIQDNNDIDPSHFLAVLNNLGRSHIHLGNSRKSTKYSEYLLATLMYVADIYKLDGIEYSDEHVVLCEGCFSNVMHLVLRDRRIAPAA